MATGYTEGVRNGRIRTFKEFALQSARAFGANILMRDEAFDAEIQEYRPSTYHLEALERAKKDLVDALRMTEAEAEQAAQEGFERDQANLKSSQLETSKERKRYEAMLNEVERWVPPTLDHMGIKKFMITQLKESIEHDCFDRSEYYTKVRMSADELREDKIQQAKDNIKYHTEHYEQELRDTKQRNDWNQALIKSLK